MRSERSGNQAEIGGRRAAGEGGAGTLWSAATIDATGPAGGLCKVGMAGNTGVQARPQNARQALPQPDPCSPQWPGWHGGGRWLLLAWARSALAAPVATAAGVWAWPSAACGQPPVMADASAAAHGPDVNARLSISTARTPSPIHCRRHARLSGPSGDRLPRPPSARPRPGRGREVRGAIRPAWDQRVSMAARLHLVRFIIL